MAKKSKARESFLKRKISKARSSVLPNEAPEPRSSKPSKLVWQMFQGDLLLTFEPVLLTQEIHQRMIHKKVLTSGKREPFAFSFHRIRNAQPVSVESVQSFVKKVISDWPEASKVQVFGTLLLREGVQENRCRLIQKELDEFYRAASNVEGSEIQIFLARPDEAYVGVAPPLSNDLRGLGIESSHLGGVFPIPESKEPPSRAYLKLTEALLFAGWKFESGQSVLDLAASPGGWTWVAVQGGATVCAVDRSELTEDLMKHPKIQFLKGDVFGFSPSTYPQWVICDVISEPEKSLELLMRYVVKISPERIVWTLKFKKEVRFRILNLVDEALVGYSYLIRHFSANKNEVTILIDNRK